MKKILITLGMLMSIAAGAQTNYEKYKDTTGTLIFKGPVSVDDLNNEQSFDWFKNGVKQYKPNKLQTPVLRQYLRQYNLLVFMGTWCDDSHNLVPKLVKVLQEIAYPMNQFTMYGVDRSKLTTNDAQQPYHITLVPTIIVLKNGKEVGRITEMVQKDIATDLVDIIERDWAMTTPSK